MYYLCNKTLPLNREFSEEYHRDLAHKEIFPQPHGKALKTHNLENQGQRLEWSALPRKALLMAQAILDIDL